MNEFISTIEEPVVELDYDAPPTGPVLNWLRGMYALANKGPFEILISSRPRTLAVALQVEKITIPNFCHWIPASCGWRQMLLQEALENGPKRVFAGDVCLTWKQTDETIHDFLALSIPLCILNQDWVYDDGMQITK
jgi:hypothetical protein